MAFWRMGQTIIAFSRHPSFNFAGVLNIRRQLRRFRANGVGSTVFVGIRNNGLMQGFSIKTCKRPFVDDVGRKAKSQWVCRHHDVVHLLNNMLFACPRCWSQDKPRRLKPELLKSHHDLDGVFGRPLLCDNCEKMDGFRNRNMVVAAVQEIAVAQREIKNLQRMVK